jgi:hypothetical protein
MNDVDVEVRDELQRSLAHHMSADPTEMNLSSPPARFESHQHPIAHVQITQQDFAAKHASLPIFPANGVIRHVRE